MASARAATAPASRRARPAPARPAPARRAPARPELHVVPAQRGRRAAPVLAAALVSVALFGLVAWHVALTQGQADLEAIQSRASSAEQRYERLRLEVAELEAPERIVAVAQRRLGMVPPPEVTYLSRSAESDVDPTETPSRAAGPGTSWPAVKAQLAGRP